MGGPPAPPAGSTGGAAECHRAPLHSTAGAAALERCRCWACAAPLPCAAPKLHTCCGRGDVEQAFHRLEVARVWFKGRVVDAQAQDGHAVEQHLRRAGGGRAGRGCGRLAMGAGGARCSWNRHKHACTSTSTPARTCSRACSGRARYTSPSHSSVLSPTSMPGLKRQGQRGRGEAAGCGPDRETHWTAARRHKPPVAPAAGTSACPWPPPELHAVAAAHALHVRRVPACHRAHIVPLLLLPHAVEVVQACAPGGVCQAGQGGGGADAAELCAPTHEPHNPLLTERHAPVSACVHQSFSASASLVMLGWKRNVGSSPGTKRARWRSSGSLQAAGCAGCGSGWGWGSAAPAAQAGVRPPATQGRDCSCPAVPATPSTPPQLTRSQTAAPPRCVW